MTGEKLKQREVVFIDIANDSISSSDFKQDEDPTKFKSQKTGRGPLVGPDWKEHVNPVMTCYKLVTVEFKWFGLQVSYMPFCKNIYKINIIKIPLFSSYLPIIKEYTWCSFENFSPGISSFN